MRTEKVRKLAFLFYSFFSKFFLKIKRYVVNRRFLEESEKYDDWRGVTTFFEFLFEICPYLYPEFTGAKEVYYECLCNGERRL